MYTSGRTVKSSKARRNPIQEATATGRRLAKRHLPPYVGLIVRSEHCCGADGVVRMKTTVLFREMDRSTTKPLADAIAALPGYHSMVWDPECISYLTKLEA